jgi:hypothetical protein
MSTVTSLMNRRRRGGVPADTPRGVVLVLRQDAAPGRQALAAARAAADDAGVVVVVPLRIHGSSLGLPNPGLLPTARERQTAERIITGAVRGLQRAGVSVDGEIVMTRRPGKVIARIARQRGASTVLVDQKQRSRLRALVEGDLVRELRRRAGAAVTVEALPAAA